MFQILSFWTYQQMGLKTLLDILLKWSKGLRGLKTHIQMHQMMKRISVGPCGPLDPFRPIWTHSGSGSQDPLGSTRSCRSQRLFARQNVGLNPQLAGQRCHPSCVTLRLDKRPKNPFLFHSADLGSRNNSDKSRVMPSALNMCLHEAPVSAIAFV